MKGVSSKVQQCIDDCNNCLEASGICLHQHLGEAKMKKCHQLCLDCISLCTACVQMLASQSDYVNRVCAVCVDLCNACAKECGKFDSDVCRQCAEKCSACAASCKAMAA